MDNSSRSDLAEHLKRTAPHAREFFQSESGKVFVEALKSHARDSAYTAIHNDDPPKLMQWRAYVLALESVISMLEAFAGMAVEQPRPRVIDFKPPASESNPAF